MMLLAVKFIEHCTLQYFWSFRGFSFFGAWEATLTLSLLNRALSEADL